MRIISPPGAGSAPANANDTYETLGLTSAGGALITASGLNTKGASADIGVTASQWSGFFLQLGPGSSASGRWLIDLSFDAFATVKVPNIFVQPGTGSGVMTVFIPLNVPAGTTISAKCQSSTSGGSIRAVCIGRVTNAASPPLFTSVAALIAADTTNTRPSTVDVPLTAAWTQLNAATAATYGAVLALVSDNGTPPAAQNVSLSLGVGAAAAEAAFINWGATILNSAPSMPRTASPIVYRSVPAGSRLTAKAEGGTPGSDNLRFQAFGFA